MVNQKNKQTFSPPRVGEVSNRGPHPLLGRGAGAECTINSKVYHSFQLSVISCKKDGFMRIGGL